jgi:hypothetical protein
MAYILCIPPAAMAIMLTDQEFGMALTLIEHIQDDMMNCPRVPEDIKGKVLENTIKLQRLLTDAKDDETA